jgi:hypothetical protein
MYFKRRLATYFSVCVLISALAAISCSVHAPETGTPLPPEIDFHADFPNGEVPLNVTFMPVATGEITHWHWDFGDENFSTISTPNHIYRTAGTYTVSLAVMGPSGSDLETKVDYIHVNAAIISWEEASEYIGQTRAIEGVIAGTYYARTSKGKPTFLNFHMPYEGYLTCVIWGDDREKFITQFKSAPEEYFLNKHVMVEGLIEEYPVGSGTPEIVLGEPSQIKIVEH